MNGPTLTIYALRLAALTCIVGKVFKWANVQMLGKEG